MFKFLGKKNIKKLLASKLAKSSGIYTLSDIIKKAIPFLLLPVLTRYLTPADYGIIAMFFVVLGLVNPFTGLGIKSAIFRTYFKKGDIDFDQYVSNGVLILISSSSLVLLLFVVFSSFISEYSGIPESWIPFIVIISAGQFIHTIVLAIWQAKYEYNKYGFFNILVTALNLGASIFLIVVLKYNWEGRALGQLIGSVVFCLVGIIILYRGGYLKFKLNKKYISHALKFGVPLIPHILSTYIITMSDRIFLTNMVGVSETGLYTVGYQIGMIVEVVAAASNKALTPWFYERLNEGKSIAKKKIVKISYLYVFSIITFSLFLSLAGPLMIKIFVSKDFYSATKFIFWVALGYAFKSGYYMVATYINYLEKTHILSWMTFFVGVLNILLNYFFIKILGSVGAAVATTVSYFSQFILVWMISMKLYPMPWFSFIEKKKSRKQ
tara:strand:- start:884 stop:2197 length:1314 start_codon:yes stop_codon:yes gene_type:complete